MIHTEKIQSNTKTQTLLPLATDRLEAVAGWGGASSGMAYVHRPSTVAQLREIFSWAGQCYSKQNGRSIGIRGGGNSYGDAAMNDESILLDLTRMNRILDWEPENGRIKVEPGVTLERVWEYVIEDGWWVPVATGTAKITVGGGAAMNVHGKNAWKLGTFGDHIYEFDLMLPSGEIVTCNREQNSDLFFAAIGGLGMLGCFTSLTLHLKRVYSGLLQVEALTQPNLSSTMRWIEDHLHNSDYLVGWLDAFAKGKRLGRSELHRGNYLKPGEDPNPSQSLRLETQHIPPEIMGFFPRSILWRLQRPFWNNIGMRFVNSAKFRAARLKEGAIYREPHVHFHFLLDSLDWKKPFGPGGLIQYQPFIPKENAEAAFSHILQLCQQRGLPNFLTVMKRHRSDPFLLTHALDGYSLAMDFRITQRNRQRVVKLARELDEIVLTANGRFYLAKDSTLRPQVTRAYLGEETITEFFKLKQQYDPENRLQTNLWRRLFASP
ncbi:MAG: FAD-binding oxidoreductase [Chloroflexi bacterium]|nr:FAD-binding oxidoreductase [Chloroflexota bacterium]